MCIRRRLNRNSTVTLKDSMEWSVNVNRVRMSAKDAKNKEMKNLAILPTVKRFIDKRDETEG